MEVAVEMSGLVGCGARFNGVAHFPCAWRECPYRDCVCFAGYRLLRLGRLRWVFGFLVEWYALGRGGAVRWEKTRD